MLGCRSIHQQVSRLVTTDPLSWQGDEYLQESELLTLNAAPTVGYKITPEISIAAGLQVEFIKARTIQQKAIAAGPVFGQQKIIADDIGVGFTLGALYKSSTTGTSVGVGYRSAVDHRIDGSSAQYTAFSRICRYLMQTFKTPEVVTASIRQDISTGILL